MEDRNIHRLWKKFRRDRGLTLLELVVVSGVLAILSAIVATSVSGRGTDTRGTTQAADVATGLDSARLRRCRSVCRVGIVRYAHESLST